MEIHNAKIYLPGLNGLRAIAALSVVFSHISLSFIDFGLNQKNGWNFASDGVTIFFTISGFLITYLLLLEKAAGTIDIKKFYIRRILRIWPLYYTYLIICVVILWLLHNELSELPYYIFFCANKPYVFGGAIFLIAHLWSIGVEEQFYIFWPLLIKLFNKRLGIKVATIIITLILLKFIVKYIMHSELFESFLNINRFECMLIGGYGALLFFNKSKVVEYLKSFVAQLIAWICLLLFAFNVFNSPGPTEHILLSIFILTIIFGQITNTRFKLINLENRLFDFLGKISYGIYVIHPLLIFMFSKILFGNFNNSIGSITLLYLLIIVATIIISFISYQFFEKPFLKMKSRYAIIKSENSRYN